MSCGCGQIQETTNGGLKLGSNTTVSVEAFFVGGIKIGSNTEVTSSRLFDSFRACLPMTELTGNYLDISGNGFDAIAINPATPDDGVYCLASQHFEDNENNIGPLVQTPVDNLTGSYSISFWLRLDKRFMSRTILSRGSDFGGDKLAISIDTTYLNHIMVSSYHANGIDRVTSRELETGRWYHLAIEYTGNKINIFINGILDKSQAVNSQLVPTGPGYIGSKNLGSYLQGNLQELRLYHEPKNEAYWSNERANLCGSLVTVSGADTVVTA